MTKNSKNRAFSVKFDASLIPYLAAMVQAVLYAQAGKVYFDNYFLGGFIGILPSFSMAFGASRLASVRADERKKEAKFFRNALLIISPAVIAPAVFFDLAHLDYGHPDVTFGVKMVVSILIALVPDFSIYFAGVVAGQSLIGLSSSQSGGSNPQSGGYPRSDGRSNSQSNRRANRSDEKREKLTAPCPVCDKPLSAEYAGVNGSRKLQPTTNATNAHARHCKKKVGTDA